MSQVVVGDHDVTRGDGEQRASIAIVWIIFCFWRFDEAFIDFQCSYKPSKITSCNLRSVLLPGHRIQTTTATTRLWFMRLMIWVEMFNIYTKQNQQIFGAIYPAQDHDIAIIQLAQPVQFSDSVAPVTTIIAINHPLTKVKVKVPNNQTRCVCRHPRRRATTVQQQLPRGGELSQAGDPSLPFCKRCSGVWVQSAVRH